MGESTSLKEKERARAQQMRAAVIEQIPDAVPLIRDLHRAGLIAGWRNVTYVGPPRGPIGISAREYLDNSNT